MVLILTFERSLFSLYDFIPSYEIFYLNALALFS
jgi:hypothetical protein